MSNFREKYYKYKSKYLELEKNLQEGGRIQYILDKRPSDGKPGEFDTNIVLRDHNNKELIFNNVQLINPEIDLSNIVKLIEHIFPNIKIDDKYLTYESVESLILSYYGSYGFTTKFTDIYNRKFVMKIIFPKIVSNKKHINELDMTFKICNPKNNFKNIIKCFGYIDFQNKIIKPNELIHSQNIKLVNGDIACIILEQGLFDLTKRELLDTDNKLAKLLNHFKTKLKQTNSNLPDNYNHIIYKIYFYFYLFVPLLNGLNELHNFGPGYIHGDIKPSNIILINDNTMTLIPKIIDFGSLEPVKPGFKEVGTTAKGGIGTRGYIPLFEKKHNAKYYSTDIYQVGLTLMIFIFNYNIKDPESNKQLLENIKQQINELTQDGNILHDIDLNLFNKIINCLITPQYIEHEDITNPFTMSERFNKISSQEYFGIITYKVYKFVEKLNNDILSKIESYKK